VKKETERLNDEGALSNNGEFAFGIMIKSGDVYFDSDGSKFSLIHLDGYQNWK
jgi:hypothetical protein